MKLPLYVSIYLSIKKKTFRVYLALSWIRYIKRLLFNINEAARTNCHLERKQFFQYVRNIVSLLFVIYNILTNDLV